MKILAVAYNYPRCRAEELEGLSPIALERGEPIIYHKGDSLHRLGRPFYIPDWATDITCGLELAVQIDRVGKCISERFAHRYYSKISVGLGFTARSLYRDAVRGGLPWTEAKVFDSSAVVGEWIDKGMVNYPHVPVELCLECTDAPVQMLSTGDMIHSVDKIIAHISRQHTLKMGDIILTGATDSGMLCEIGQTIKGYLNGRLLLELEIK